jgi:hypothetical protein
MLAWRGLNLPVARGMRVISGLGEEFCSIPRERLADVRGTREVDFVPRDPHCPEAKNKAYSCPCVTS